MVTGSEPVGVALGLTDVGAGTFRANPGSDWFLIDQPLVGLVAAMVVSLADELMPEMTVSSVNVDFTAPVHPAPFDIRVDEALRGNRIQRFVIAGGAAVASARCSPPGPAPLIEPSAQPPAEVRSPGEYRTFVPARGRSPHFMKYFEYHPLADGPDAPEPRRGWEGVWIGLRQPRRLDRPLAAVVASAWFPALHQRLGRHALLHGISARDPDYQTVGTSVVHFAGEWPDGPPGRHKLLLLQGVSALSEGYAVEDAELWLEGHQLIAVTRTTLEIPLVA